MKPESFEDLVSLYFDHALDAEGMAELNRLLASKPDLAARFVRMGRVHAGIKELSGSRSSSVRPGASRRKVLLWMTPAAAAAGFLVLTLFIARPSARLEDSSGQVVFDGSSLETPVGGSGTVRLPDGTRLHAGSETAFTIESGRVTLRRGTLAADVAKQKPGQTLVFSTPQAEAKVLGTRLFLSIEGDSTLCRVEEGHVQVVRQGSDQAVDVRGGFYAVATPQAELKAEPVAKPVPTTSAPTIRFIAPDRWPKTFASYPFREGSLLYRDRGWRITTIPAELDGAVGIATFAEDRKSQEASHLVFEIDREADVWVGIDTRSAKNARKVPDWMKDWESTGLKIYSKTAGNSTFQLYRRRFPAGTVTLGGNHHGGDTGAGVNYTVLVTVPGK